MPTLLDEKSPLSERRRPAWQLEFFIRSGNRGECVYQLYGGGVACSAERGGARRQAYLLLVFCLFYRQKRVSDFYNKDLKAALSKLLRPPSLNRSFMDDSPSFHQARLERATSALRHLVILQATGPGKTNPANLRRGNRSQNNNRKRRNVLSPPSKSNLFHAYLTI